jgi:hypothetical protein
LQPKRQPFYFIQHEAKLWANGLAIDTEANFTRQFGPIGQMTSFPADRR